MIAPASTMQPHHPKWRELLVRLEAVKLCRRTTEHTRAILASMDGVDVDASLLALRKLGGYCDCAILYDIEEEAPRRAG
jgi:hypothetical protein